MKELTKKEVKVIRKLLRKGVEVPQICKDYGIPPENWRDVSIKYDLFK
ncbi:MAG: hypothetical protein M1393_08915 [Candidatus Thermoplasmatota archaeon]|nr:hypothetical protein [Candidatus Thermoplasmatota archaeon]MDA8143859.1 hypothetical protein [Thermoplasmatales archaeon]